MKERQKQFEKLPNEYKILIISALKKIQTGNLDGLDIEKLGKIEYRCRVGKYRIIFTRTGKDGIILKIGPRGDVYK